ncbi:hypothetical protein NLI96_g11838 [Meripilus lineatus]|uniref:Uncharacterized protein n=1 Tax=Meripilus lineatus TaxID=2056292 RepID=A0AAD5USG2_9APHY|nr:hypothetical protein NLI96_g11838 [Physisporinus lineatus]
MASSAQVAPPSTSPAPGPSSPTNNLRNRQTNNEPEPTSAPTSPTVSNTSQPAFDPTRAGYRSLLPSFPSTSTDGVNVINLNTPPRKFVLRSDPAMVSCFDPADKELYNLWAPRR